MIDELRKLLEAYDYCNSSNSPLILELEMWRLRFLQEKNNEISENIAKKVYTNFLYMPTEMFIKNSPEENLKISIDLE